MLLRLHGLLENGLAPGVLLAHGFGCGFHVAKRPRLDGFRMRNHRTRVGINLQDRTAARACHFEIGGLLCHLSESYRKLDWARETSHPEDTVAGRGKQTREDVLQPHKRKQKT